MWSPSRALAERAAKRKSQFTTVINLWPLVGVLIAMLFTLMTNSPPMHYHPFGYVERVMVVHATAQPEAVRDDALRTIVARNGKVFFGNRRVNVNDLPEAIGKALKAGAERKVYLSVDARSKYGATGEVLREVARSGISRVCFIVDQQPTL